MSRSAHLRAGIGLIAGALLLMPFGTARAQEPAEQPLTVVKQGYWTRSLGHVAPNVLTTHFPPTAVCLLRPELCVNPLSPVLAQGDEQVVAHQPEATVPGGDPAGLLMAGGTDHLPTGVTAGARRYLSAIRFDLPAVPAGHGVSRFELKLAPVEELSFHFDSPAFRQVVLAVMVGIETKDGEAVMAELERAGTPPHEPERHEVHLGVEACPIVGGVDWKGEPGQDGATAPERDVDERRDGESLGKQVDCNLGANGRLQDGKWVFDLTFTANAWADGKLPNNGLLFRPVLPPNVAYGDPDLSTWDQVVFYSAVSAPGDGEKPVFTFATGEKARLVTLGPARMVGARVLGDRTETFTETFGALDEPSAPLDAPVPEAGGTVQRAIPALSGTPVTEWWVWLFLPMFLAGAYLTAQALTAEPAPVTAQRAGAMTRLMESRRRGDLT